MRIALIKNNVVANIIESELAWALTLGYDAAVEASADADIGGGYADGVFTAPPSPREGESQPPPGLGTRITPLAFINRWAQEEEIAIRTAAKDSVAIEALIARVQLASFIDLADPRTVAGIDALVSAGLLTQARGTAILTDPVQSVELPQAAA